MRHGGEEVLADDVFGHRKTRGERADQPGHDIVAVDAEAPFRPEAIPCRQPFGNGAIRIEECGGEFGLGGDGHGRSSCRPAVGGAAQDGTGRFRLGSENRPFGDVIIPLDQARNRPGAGDQLFIERPDGILDGGVVAVDQ